eukprot:2641286-Amphidinium_carterae.1
MLGLYVAFIPLGVPSITNSTSSKTNHEHEEEEEKEPSQIKRQDFIGMLSEECHRVDTEMQTSSDEEERDQIRYKDQYSDESELGRYSEESEKGQINRGPKKGQIKWK